ncbi:hypothetical protein OSTOST_20066 [Ostertagia ostertagi]
MLADKFSGVSGDCVTQRRKSNHEWEDVHNQALVGGKHFHHFASSPRLFLYDITVVSESLKC